MYFAERTLSLASSILLLFPGATGAGRHEARVCIVCIISSSFVLLVSLPLSPCFCFTRITASQSAHSCTLTIIASATLHTASRHVSLGKVSISWAAPLICGIHPSIAFLPSLGHHCCPSPLEPQESKPSSVCCLTPYGLLLPYRHRVVSRPSNALGQIYHARNNHAISACSRFCIAPLCLLACSLAICGAYLHCISILRSLIFSR
jgi:hypothetical protein